jgi:high affinity sulfate transporter 1
MTSSHPRLARWLPGVALLRSYRRAWLGHDLIAGIILTALLVPQGMAYAELAGLPPVTGLYATMVPLIVYFLVGPSRMLVLGPDSAVSPLIAAAIIGVAVTSTAERVALGGMLALMVGALFLLAGFAKFGFITDLLSKPVRVGYLAGIAIVVIAGQLPKLFGFAGDSTQLVQQIEDFVTGFDQANWRSLAIGIACLSIILAGRRWAPRLPAVFVAVVGATVLVAVLDLASEGVAVVGAVPEGLPPFTFPDIDVATLGELALAAVGIAFVAFADTSVLSRSYAGRLHQEVDQNREAIAMGAANAATGLFQGFPISTSSSRTAVAEDIGSKTQLTGLIGAVAIAIVLLFATGLLQDMPSAALAAVVIAAVLTLIEVGTLKRLLRARRSEFVLATATFLGVAFLGVLPGIGVAIGMSLLNFIRRAWHPHDAVLGRVDGLKGYHDTSRYPQARRVPELVLYRFDAPLFFANANYFRAQIRQLAAGSPQPHWIVVAAEAMTDIDSTAAELLEELLDELDELGIVLAFAEMKDPVRDRLRAYRLLDRFEPDRLFPTVGTAVRTYIDATETAWVDWEDRKDAADVARHAPKD